MSDKTYIVERRKILAICPAPVDLVGVWNNDDGTIFTAPVDCLALVEVSEANYRAGKRISDWKVSEYGPIKANAMAEYQRRQAEKLKS